MVDIDSMMTRKSILQHMGSTDGCWFIVIKGFPCISSVYTQIIPPPLVKNWNWNQIKMHLFKSLSHTLHCWPLCNETALKLKAVPERTVVQCWNGAWLQSVHCQAKYFLFCVNSSHGRSVRVSQSLFASFFSLGNNGESFFHGTWQEHNLAVMSLPNL